MIRRRVVAIGAVMLTAIALTGCASGTPEPAPATNGEQEVATLRVGVLPIANLAPLYAGMEQGFFEEEGLIIEPTVTGGGAEVVASLISGDLDVGWSSTPGTVIGASRGLPLRVVAPGTIGPVDADNTEGSGGLVSVAPDSPIETPADLEGKTIAVNTIGNILTVTIRAGLENLGVDSSTVQFVEVPYSEMGGLLDSGQVDAASLSEPFYTGYMEGGGRLIFGAFYAAAPGLPTGHWVSVENFVQENTDVMERFNRAIKKSNEFANANNDAAREAIGTFTQIPPALISKINLDLWATDADVEGLQTVEEITRKYGPADLEEVDMSTIVVFQ